MDYGTIIGRAWTITRRYTWLWIPELLVVGPGSGNVDLPTMITKRRTAGVSKTGEWMTCVVC